MTLREHRQRLHLSIDELSRRTGIERSRISRAERGYTALHPHECDAVAAHVGVRPEELVIHDPTVG